MTKPVPRAAAAYGRQLKIGGRSRTTEICIGGQGLYVLFLIVAESIVIIRTYLFRCNANLFKFEFLFSQNSLAKI